MSSPEAQRRLPLLFLVREIRIGGEKSPFPTAAIDTPAAPAYIRWDWWIAEEMTPDSFGEHLRREREMRGVSLDEISAATRIATRFLRAIENEQWDQLPGGVFNRGFVRAVAHYLGLDEESIVAEYALAAGDRPGIPVWTGSPPAVTPDQPWMAWFIAGVVVVALIAGGWFGVRRIAAWRMARRAARNAVVSASSSPTSSSPAPGMRLDNVAVSSSDSTPNSNAAPAVTPAVTGSGPAADATAPAAEPFELKIEAGKKTRLTVEADASRVFDGTVKPGESHTFTAQNQFDVSAHDAGALLLELNGKTLAPIGPPGHAGKVTLTREALKGAAGGGN